MDEFRHGGRVRTRRGDRERGGRRSRGDRQPRGVPRGRIRAGSGVSRALARRSRTRPAPRAPQGTPFGPGFTPRQRIRPVQPTMMGRPRFAPRIRRPVNVARRPISGTPFGPGFRPRSFQEGGDVTAIPAPRTPGEILLGIRQALTPRFVRRGLLPSGREFIGSRVSALGLSPEDFFTDVERGFPQGIDPSRITRANFSTGGTVYSAPRFRIVA